MRRIVKFSALKLRLFSFFYLKQRLLRFKRPKWLPIKKILKPFLKIINLRQKYRLRLKIRNKRGRLLYNPFRQNFTKKKSIKKQYTFSNEKLKQVALYFSQPAYLFRRYSRWTRVKLLFKESLQMKRRLFSYYDFSFRTSVFVQDLKKSKLRNYFYSVFFIKPEYRLDVILWRLNFFFSVYAARHAIRAGLISYNFLPITKIMYVSGGGVWQLNVKKCKYSFLKSIKRWLLFSLVPNYLEVDFYSGLILCLISMDSHSLSDSITIKRNSFNFCRLQNYLIKKH